MYLQSQPELQKWEAKKKNFKILEILIVYQVNVLRNHWPMARIIGANINKKRLVRSVLLRMAERSGNEHSKRKWERPVDKSALIPGRNEVRFSTEKGIDMLR